MSYRLRRKSRPQADVEIYGGPLKQRRFDGGMNIDTPASEIKDNEISEGVNIICREHGVEPRPGSIEISEAGFSDSLTDCTAFVSNPLRFGTGGTNYKNTIIKSQQIRYYGENPKDNVYQGVSGYDYQTGFDAGWLTGTGDTTVIPYRRGFMIFNASKISYAERSGAFQVNSLNPVHGIHDDNASGAFQYRYLLTLSRIATYAADGTQSSGVGAFAVANRLVAGAEVVHESGTNGARYNAAGTSTAKSTSYGEVFRATAISVSSAYALTNADLLAAFSSAAGVTNNLAARHFTHVTVWRNCDFGAAGAALGNNKAIFYWVADVLREDVVSGAGFSDTLSDKSIQDTGIILQTQGYEPMPSGSCGAIAGGWMFVSDRTNTVSENYLNYCAIAQFPENIGYHFRDIQKWRFNQGIRALRATSDILSIFCESSTHICNMTSYVASASNLQAVPFLNYFNEVDGSIGIKDWETLDAIDKNTFIAVCSDNTVRVWDTTKWGDDLAYEKCSSEIRQIVPASVENYEQGSIGRYWNGAYYLYYSKDLTDTAPTHCLRYGFGKKAGFGWTFYEETPMPNFKRGVCVANHSQGVSRLLVLRASNGKFYWVETFKPFVGATDTTDIGLGPASHQMDRVEKDFVQYENDTGDEIASSWKFRELIANSESDFLVHDETFHRWRKFDPAAGYNPNMSVSMSAYKDGSLTAWETITEQPKSGSLKFQKEVAARRIQLEVSTDAAGWKYVGIESNFRSLDKIKMDVAGDVSSSDSTVSYPQFQQYLSTDLDFWLTRRDAGLDRATGVQMTEATAGQPTLSEVGPDGKTDSAYLFVGDAVNDHDYTEAWTSANSYWTLVDEDFATYPGYLAADSGAFSANAVFNGGTLFDFPVSVEAYPLKTRHTVRVLSNNATNTAFCIWSFASDLGFVGDYLSVVLSYQVSTDTYYMEVFGQKNGNPTYDVMEDVNIAQSADGEYIVDIEISATGYKVSMPQYGFMMSDTGWVFETLNYIDITPQRTDAANQGMLKETRIWNDTPGTDDARYDETVTLLYQNDFCTSFWVKQYAYARDIFRVDGDRPMYAQLIDATHLDFSGLGVVAITAVGAGWNHFFINRIGTNIYVYQNGVLKGTFTDANTSLGGGTQVHVGPTNLTGYVADVRLFDDDKTLATMVYYYDNVLNFEGDQVMPQV